MTHLSWKIGDVRITRVVEFEMVGLEWVLEEASPENLAEIPWLSPHFVNAGHEAILSIHALVIETPDRRILVDTCVGNDKNLSAVPEWHMRTGDFLQDLAGAGFARDSVDTVLCTHLHVDHVGWNTVLEHGVWKPTFPRARYLIAETEWKHWSTRDDRFSSRVLSESVRPVFDAGLVDLVDVRQRICDEVWLEPTPGHTPGHVSVRVSSAGEDAVITGDMIHHPCQLAKPAWGCTADVDFDRGVQTRKEFLEQYAEGPVLVIGTHFAGPTAGRVVRDGDAYRLDV
jgi:glyoxylase-like metal-dependent hydrolase (beta-lactamase superfamily II)